MRPGDRFGQYVLLDKIAEGGMAEIFRAEVRRAYGFVLDVCIKRIRPSVSQDRMFVEMFIDEARICSRLRHSNIVAVHDFGELNGTLFAAMEWVHGTDASRVLRAVRTDGRLLPLDAGLFILGEVLKALEYAHGKHDNGVALQIVHRDVSPHNVLVSFSGEVKLGDFGIAKATSRLHATVGDVVKGKVSYMAPEQALGRPLDGRADLFAVGVTAFELLTGERPFTGTTHAQILDAALKNRRPDLRDRRPDAPPAVCAFVDKLLAPDRDDRYPDAAAALDALSLLPIATGARTLTALMGHYYPGQSSTVRDSAWLLRAPLSSPAPVSVPAPSPSPSPDDDVAFAETSLQRTRPVASLEGDVTPVLAPGIQVPPEGPTTDVDPPAAVRGDTQEITRTAVDPTEQSGSRPTPPRSVTATELLAPPAQTSRPMLLALTLLVAAVVLAATALAVTFHRAAPIDSVTRPRDDRGRTDAAVGEPTHAAITPDAAVVDAAVTVHATHDTAVATAAHPTPAVGVVPVTVFTQPWGMVRVDGTLYAGQSAVHHLYLTVGTHDVQALQSSASVRRKTLTVRAGHPTSVTFNFLP